MFGTAMEDGLLRPNPVAGLRIGAAMAEQGNAGEEEVKALTVEELGRLVAEVPAGSSRLLVSLLAQTGLRMSEGLGLRWQDLDTAGRRIHVRQRIRDGAVGAPKSGRSRRDVPLADRLQRELVAHRLASPRSEESDLVFADGLGGPLHARDLYRWFKPAARRAGVPWAAFHALRHTTASRWLHSGVTIAQVSRLLGHEDPAFTLRVYVSVLPSDSPSGETLAAAVGLG